jgi:threonine/homoserine efflux transporter RhtA
VRQIGAQTVALMMAFVPGLSALAAVPVLGEPLSLLSLAGLAAVTARGGDGRATGAETRQLISAPGVCAAGFRSGTAGLRVPAE